MSIQTDFYRVIGSGIAVQAAEVALWGHICDRIKVTQQTHVELKTAKQALKYLYNKGGAAEIYKGFGWNLGAGILKGAERWIGYQGFYTLFQKVLSEEVQKKHPCFVSGCVGVSSAAVSATVNCPMENLKIREMTSSQKFVFKTPRFFFRGWGQMFIKQGCSSSSFLASYEFFKQIVASQSDGPSTSLYKELGASAGAALVSSAAHTPIDMLKTHAQQENPTKVIPSARAIFKQGGFLGFYQGFPIKAARSMGHAVFTVFMMNKLDALPEQMKIN